MRAITDELSDEATERLRATGHPVFLATSPKEAKRYLIAAPLGRLQAEHWVIDHLDLSAEWRLISFLPAVAGSVISNG